ncbi:hypothetical protein [Massilia genomosp. 1]|uniref:DUF1842 domain-containing protein n=1 Tax=Massilia genomosp. 1 TaxID=2609280 RepID=A0ABX0MF96_9BURK|nr:hypothetical protein [Massilia genomosp. 1]NHZ61487.1 hypothetical protein [Massilia genomosp. 1]
MSQYTFTIAFKSGVKIATFTTNCPRLPTGLYNPQSGDTLKFIFICKNEPIEIHNGKLMATNMHLPEASSPFNGVVDGAVPIINNSVVSFDVISGDWCFYISFYARNNSGQWEFHLLPDPELQVGSIPNEKNTR